MEAPSAERILNAASLLPGVLRERSRHGGSPGRVPSLFPSFRSKPMGRTLESKQQIVEELKQLLGEADMALVLDFKGLTIKEMSDLRTRLQASNGVCKVTKNTLMRRAIDGDSAWSNLETLLTGTNAFILVKGDVGGAVKAVQSFQKDSKKSETKGGLFEGKLLSQDDIKAIGELPSKEVLMAQIAGAINGVATKLAVGINEVPSGLARALKQHAESGEG
jgi:large subunit ribosomal protein L10